MKYLILSSLCAVALSVTSCQTAGLTSFVSSAKMDAAKVATWEESDQGQQTIHLVEAAVDVGATLAGAPPSTVNGINTAEKAINTLSTGQTPSSLDVANAIDSFGASPNVTAKLKAASMQAIQGMVKAGVSPNAAVQATAGVVHNAVANPTAAQGASTKRSKGSYIAQGFIRAFISPYRIVPIEEQLFGPQAW